MLLVAMEVHAGRHQGQDNISIIESQVQRSMQSGVSYLLTDRLTRLVQGRCCSNFSMRAHLQAKLIISYHSCITNSGIVRAHPCPFIDNSASKATTGVHWVHCYSSSCTQKGRARASSVFWVAQAGMKTAQQGPFCHDNTQHPKSKHSFGIDFYRVRMSLMRKWRRKRCFRMMFQRLIKGPQEVIFTV